MSFYDKDKKVRLRLCLDPKERFPEKLYDVANDNFLIKWGKSGESVIVVDADTFENNVMKCYPGFLQITSFNNLRRLFREYGFDWKVNNDGTMEFSHDFFVRNQPQLLDEVVTRRKSFSRPNQQAARPKPTPSPQTSTPLGRRRSVRRAVLGSQFQSYRSAEGTKSPRSVSPVDDSYTHISPRHVAEIYGKQNKDLIRCKRKLDPVLLTTYAKNEMTEDEIVSLLQRRHWTLGRLEGPDDETYTPQAGTEWMYMFWDTEHNPFQTPHEGLVTDPWMTSGRMENADHDLTQLLPVAAVQNQTNNPCCPCRCHNG